MDADHSLPKLADPFALVKLTGTWVNHVAFLVSLTNKLWMFYHHTYIFQFHL